MVFEAINDFLRGGQTLSKQKTSVLGSFVVLIADCSEDFEDSFQKISAYKSLVLAMSIAQVVNSFSISELRLLEKVESEVFTFLSQEIKLRKDKSDKLKLLSESKNSDRTANLPLGDFSSFDDFPEKAKLIEALSRDFGVNTTLFERLVSGICIKASLTSEELTGLSDIEKKYLPVFSPILLSLVS